MHLRIHSVRLAALIAAFSAYSIDAAVCQIADGDVLALKHAITVANTNGEDDTIELASTGDYVLTAVDNMSQGPNGLPQIDPDGGHFLTISGRNATIHRSTLDGVPRFRIMFVSPGANVTIQGATLSNGNTVNTADGGAIYILHARATLVNDVFENNAGGGAAGAIMIWGFSAPATLIVRGCLFVGNSAESSGAISVHAGSGGSLAVKITDTTFDHNSARGNYGAGAIESYSQWTKTSVQIDNCTFRLNTGANGGAITNDSGWYGDTELVVSNSTFSGNSAGNYGGAIYNQVWPAGATAHCDVTSCTFDSNSATSGGSICNQRSDPSGTALVTIANSLFHGPGISGHLFSVSGTIDSLGHNISDDGGSGFLTGVGDQTATDAMLDPSGLQEHGGPTSTIALLPGSPAINAGGPDAPSRDQRYYLRSGIPDIGAFEFGGTLAPITAVSRKTHGGLGTFDIDLPLTGAAGIECRSGGATGDYQVITNFATGVTAKNASLTSGNGSATLSSVNGSEVTIGLTNVANAQQIAVTLSGVNDGVNTSNVVIPMRILIGDTSADGSVNSADISQAKAKSGQAVDLTNFRTDVNADGSLNSADISLVKSKSGTGLLQSSIAERSNR